MKIALLFDGLSALGKAPEVQLLDSIEAVESALLDWATEVVRVPVSNDGRWFERDGRVRGQLDEGTLVLGRKGPLFFVEHFERA